LLHFYNAVDNGGQWLMDKKDKDKETFTFTLDNMEYHGDFGSPVESLTVSTDSFNGLTATTDIGMPFPYEEQYSFSFDETLKEKYPALKQAWEHYQSVLKMCQAKELEENNAD